LHVVRKIEGCSAMLPAQLIQAIEAMKKLTSKAIVLSLAASLFVNSPIGSRRVLFAGRCERCISEFVDGLNLRRVAMSRLGPLLCEEH
jgi:hypothetical protein